MASNGFHDSSSAAGRDLRPDDFRRMRAVFESALELPENERAHYLAEACGSDPTMLAEVRRMVAADSDSFPLLDGTARRPERLQAGETIAGQFVVEGLLGRGGMGEVYRCRDTRLGRTVAVKVLPRGNGHNSDALARFRREAQLLASLNHPNIATIHSTEQFDGAQALILEFIDGPTLGDLIAAGPMRTAEALAIARQIADALETAHDAGIIHRDLKPANVKVRPDGSVKVLDFGLAKVRAHAPAAEPVSAPGPGDPITTDAQALFGTPAYMSPEQVRGEPLDRRSDIWAFGAVLYEMLTGQAPFARGSTSETLAAVLKDEVNWARLPPSTPLAIRKLAARCLERDRRRRLRDIGEARIALEDAAAADVTAVRTTPRRYRALAAVAAVVLVAASVLLLRRNTATQSAPRLAIVQPHGQALNPNRNSIAISPDGTRIVYATTAGLRVRSLSALEPIPVRGTESFFNLTEPTFSPDGKWIAFHTSSDHMIKRIPVEGGTALNVCQAAYPSSLTWAPAGILYVEPGNAEFAAQRANDAFPRDGILLVAPEGGTPKHLVHGRGREVYHGPQLLPGGRHLLYTLADGNSPDAWDKAEVVVHELATGTRTSVLRGGTDARFVPPGYLVYAVAGNLMAAPFDERQLRVTGAALPVVEGVMRAAPASTGGAQYSISGNGTLIYAPGPASLSKEIVITDRKGPRERLPLPPNLYETPRVSPRGDQIAFAIAENGKSDIFVYDLSRQTAMRRLTGQGNNRLPTWSSHGTRIAYQSDRGGDRGIFWQRADGSDLAIRLTTAQKDEAHEPEAWSPGDNILLFSRRRRREVVLSAVSPTDGQVRPFGDVSSSTPTGATFSPDGRWVAYGSTVPQNPARLDMRGRTTITVQPFPPTGAKHEFAHEGRPNHPQWSRDGRELFFIPGPGEFKAVSVTRPVFSFGNALSLPLASGPAHTLNPRAYDVLPDGRFVSVFPLSYDDRTNQIVVVMNWIAELQARLRNER